MLLSDALLFAASLTLAYLFRFEFSIDAFYAGQLRGMLIMAFILISYRFEGYSRAVFLMDGGLTFLLSGGLRMVIRTFCVRLDRNGLNSVEL